MEAAGNSWKYRSLIERPGEGSHACLLHPATAQDAGPDFEFRFLGSTTAAFRSSRVDRSLVIQLFGV